MPSNRPSRFWDKHAEKYSRSPISDEAAYQHKLKITREYFQPQMQVLELGCGTGSTAISHTPYVQHIHATDLSKNMLEIAHTKAANQNIANITFEQTTVEELHLEEASQDAVLALSLLHLLEDRHAAIKKIHHLLKPGGIFVSSTVCLGEMRNPIKYLLPLGYKLGLLPLVKSLNKEQLQESVEMGGFTIEYLWQPKKGSAVFIVARKS